MRRAAAPVVLGALVIALAYATLALPGRVVDQLVEEDGWFEWSGAIGLFVATGLYAAAGVTARRRARAVGRTGVLPWTLLLLGFVMFVGGGEEISWGQRLFGWGTPPVVGAVNAQNETDLHNLNLFHGLFDMDRLFSLGWLGLFVLVPLAAFASWRWRARLSAVLPVAPLGVAVLFIASYAMHHLAARIPDLFGGRPSIYSGGHAATEIFEATAEILIAVAAFVALRRARGGPAAAGRGPGTRTATG